MIFLLINLVFESGGIKGLAYVGAIKYFESRGYKIFKASGTSVGAIFATLVIAGYKADEMVKIINRIDIDDLVKANNFKNKLKSQGIYNVSGIEKVMDEVLRKKGISTFSDVKFGEDYLLKIVVTDNIKKEMVVFPNDLNKYGYDKDNFKISKAVAMSCAIPLFYSKYQIGDNRFVDGGATCRFPLDLVKDDKILTYGLKVNKDDRFINKLQKVIYKCVESKKSENMEIIFIDTLNIRSIQFTKGLKNRVELYKAGYLSVANFFNNK